MKATQRQPKGLHGTTVADNEQSSAIRREDPSQGKVPSWLQPCSEVAYFREITIPPSNGNREHFEAYQGFFVGRTARTGNLGRQHPSAVLVMTCQIHFAALKLASISKSIPKPDGLAS